VPKISSTTRRTISQCQMLKEPIFSLPMRNVYFDR
jgi:hypothetical protein